MESRVFHERDRRISYEIRHLKIHSQALLIPKGQALLILSEIEKQALLIPKGQALLMNEIDNILIDFDF